MLACTESDFAQCWSILDFPKFYKDYSKNQHKDPIFPGEGDFESKYKNVGLLPVLVNAESDSVQCSQFWISANLILRVHAFANISTKINLSATPF